MPVAIVPHTGSTSFRNLFFLNPRFRHSEPLRKSDRSHAYPSYLRGAEQGEVHSVLLLERKSQARRPSGTKPKTNVTCHVYFFLSFLHCSLSFFLFSCYLLLAFSILSAISSFLFRVCGLSKSASHVSSCSCSCKTLSESKQHACQTAQ